VSEREIKNLAASIHRRLLNKANEEGRPFNELLQYFAMERFLYRLSKSRHGTKFVLKGALMVLAWEAPVSRPTSDIDLLGMVENDVAVIASIVKDICAESVVPDGLEFDARSIRAETITDIAEYSGVRVRLLAHLGPARVNIQCDIGFGDPVSPGAEDFDYPVLLDLPAPRLKGYSRGSVIAEKLESIARFGMLNSRLKDFYDIWLLASQFDFTGKTLGAAIEATFSNRKRAADVGIGMQIKAYADDEARAAQWQAFSKKNRLTPAPPDLVETAGLIIEFIDPVVGAISSGERCAGRWRAAGPWE
jgi:predicted nucleotidyltransferase component of viral defense system